MTYTIGELVMEAYARASRVTSDPEIEAVLATRLLAAWLARSTLASPKSDSLSRPSGALAGRPIGRRQDPDGMARRSRTGRSAAQRAGFVGSVPVQRAVV